MENTPIQVGDKLPEATLRTLGAAGIDKVKTGDFFAGKKVVLFAIPGAFTPTCTKTHLPSYVNEEAALKAKGVDDIACVAVNDVFVLDAWAESTGAKGKVTMLSDGNADFSKALGLTFDGTGLGFGTRSLRYAMVVENGTVKALEVEENPGTCQVSSAASILEKL